MIRIAICDDEPISADIISTAARSVFWQQKMEVTTDIYLSVAELDKKLNELHYDLLLLDIDISDMDGIAYGEALRKSGNQIDIIYISSYENRVFDALKVHPDTFIRKNNLIAEASRIVECYNKSHQSKPEPSILIQKKDCTMRIPVNDIIYIEGSRRYQLITLSSESEPISVIHSMEQLESELSRFGFLRIHKGYLVNYKYIQKIENSMVLLTNRQNIPVSRRKIKQIKDEFLNLVTKEGSVVI